MRERGHILTHTQRGKGYIQGANKEDGSMMGGEQRSPQEEEIVACLGADWGWENGDRLG